MDELYPPNSLANWPLQTSDEGKIPTESTSFLETPQTRTKETKKNLPPWRRSIAIWLAAATVVFVINLVFLVYVYVHGTTDDLLLVFSRTLYEGSCSTSHSINIGLHVLINILSTLLVTGSSYCMQVLSAPTRREVDLAHSKQKWLDIGVLSFRNLGRISKWRVTLWVLLSISSATLHLFYNSSIFLSLSNIEYTALSVNQAYGQLNNLSAQDPSAVLNAIDNVKYYNSVIYWDGFDSTGSDESITQHLVDGAFEKLDTIDCLNAYAQDFQSSWGDLLVVASANVPANDSNQPAVFAAIDVTAGNLFNSWHYTTPYPWICNQITSNTSVFCPDYIDSFRNNISSWKPFGYSVSYCLSEPQLERCRVQSDLSLGLIAGILSLAKVVIICIIFFAIKQSPLLTVGDAILSFIKHPDLTTRGMCLLDRDEVARLHREKSTKVTSTTEISARWISAPRPFWANRRKWASAVSRRRWLFFFLFFSGLFTSALILLAYGLSQMKSPNNIRSLWRLGIGSVHPSVLIDFPLTTYEIGFIGLLSMVTLANTPQVFLASLYFVLNGLMTSMLLSSEWNDYSVDRKALRISGFRTGSLRSAYFLSLPFRYSIPLITISTFLHWLASQSFFLVSLQFSASEEVSEIEGNSFLSTLSDYYTCGYSPLAIIFMITVVGILGALVAILAFRKFRTGMPIAGSCSVAISAACHGLDKDVKEGNEAPEEPLMWGVVGVNRNGVEHCGFSSGEVEFPQNGKIYA